jgi:hypothetical protein
MTPAPDATVKLVLARKLILTKLAAVAQALLPRMDP